MNKLSFIHLTDTHVLKDYQGSFLEGLDKNSSNPSDQLIKILQFAEARKNKLDFLLVTGDLVHEGDVEDYQHLKSLLEEHTSLPIHLNLGNHDVTPAYWEAFHQKLNCEDELFYTVDIDGFRLIVLDSSYDKSGTGRVSEEQLAWLKDVLAVPSQFGSLVTVHHPIDEDMSFGDHSLVNSEELLKVLDNEEIIAVLSGHIHKNWIKSYPHFLLSAAEGTCFGVEFDGEKADFTDNSAFNICTIENGQLQIEVTRVPENNQVLFSYELNLA
ncbi:MULTISPECIES: metallophosphoesterase family protein [Gracilibacillus]|uniref:metallophosphoesterase family protein n=1 Tax=Gracilibacillus TaxID=74385 RepID=UPI0008267562|nr:MULTISPECIES: metallophosphoesterase [Gracilibacillus]